MKEGLELKAAVLKECFRRLVAQLTTIESSMNAIRESKSSETKSSAGDKFETGRAMLQLEENNLKQQLAAALGTRQLLTQAERQPTGGTIAIGSLVAMDKGLYFVSAGFGKVSVNGRDVFCTSPESPIGRRLIGKGVGEAFLFNEVRFVVLGFV
ncbi:3-oxoacyl-ACP synthase [Neolewinella antarctica]|uniref:3-oxoacyl-ACP synthase n=1 Tax=Neolewinella antarctica TaxID=442734 RepID=A0ABX0X7R0_9BACT|nr:3-oxoacyl-ACP synthase [Neolewinella antarctica]NJC25048.1 hypothetical protein [Neolewinella antarctica]